MKIKNSLKIAAAVLLLSNGAFLNAQVTMGSDKTPENFSVLELVSNQHNGLRLPQMTTAQREAMTNADFKASTESWGLQIFNTTTHCVETWNGTVWISACGFVPNVVPSNPSEELPSNRVTAFVDAMYDFQHQTLTAYLSPAGTVTAYQWEMSTDGGTTWMNIVGATSENYIVPADFMYDYANMDKNDKTQSESNSSIEVFFRCLMTSDAATGHTSSGNVLKMLFIRTNTAGYGEMNGVRYLTIQTNNNTNFPSGTMKIALLSLGQSEDNGVYNDNADDLGDFYQWGRKKDGHEHIVWSKDPSTRANMFGDGTSDLIDTGPATAADLDATGQILPTSSFYGKYINLLGSYWEIGNNKLWGNGSVVSSRVSDIPLSSWTYPTYQANNPCPGNWSVPSIWSLWDIFRGTGTDATLSSSSCTTATVNIWTYRARNIPANAAGGDIITNANGEKVFLPCAGNRNRGLLGGSTTDGQYWTNSVNSAYACNMRINISTVYITVSNANRSVGFNVRCVAE